MKKLFAKKTKRARLRPLVPKIIHPPTLIIVPTFHYSPNQNPPAPPACILQASPAAPANNKWYDSNRTWGEYAQQWENYFGFGKSPAEPEGPILPALDGLPYDHAFPFGVDPNDPSKPYAPYGFYYKKNGEETTIPAVHPDEIERLRLEFMWHPSPSDSESPDSPFNPYNPESPMDLNNVQQFFYPAKPGSPWHKYIYVERPDVKFHKSDWLKDGGASWEKRNSDYFQDNEPWKFDRDSSHHYKYAPDGSSSPRQSPYVPLTYMVFETIYLDSPIAPKGWQAVENDAAGNSAVQ